MKRIALALLTLTTIFTFTACRASQRAQWSALGTDQKVTLYLPNGQTREWISEGKVSTEEGSDGWFFKDKKTGKLVRVTGFTVIEAAE